MAGTTKPRSGRARSLVKWSVVAAALGLEIAILVPWLGRSDLTLDQLRWQWIVVAIGAETASVLALGALYRPLLRAGGVPMTRRRTVALGAAASAITATAPGGPAVASGYLYRQFRRAGGSPVLSGWSVGVAGALSVAGFGVVAGTAAAMRSADGLEAALSAAAVGIAVAAGLVALALTFLRHARPFLRVVQALRRRVPGAEARERRRGSTNIDRIVAQFAAIRPRWRHWIFAFAMAVLTWAGDFACFVLSLHAVGIGGIGIGGAAAAYGAGLATTGLSLVPGGLGTVETGMMIGLAQAGIAARRAVTGIVAYRLVAYVLVAGIGWSVWAVLRRGQRSRADSSAAAENADAPAGAAEDSLIDWSGSAQPAGCAA